MRLLRPRNATTIAADFLKSCGQRRCAISLPNKENKYATA